MLHKNRVKNRTHMTSFRVIIISFFCLILVGTLLLMLPISSRQRCVTCKGYCYILVSVWAGGHSDANSDRRYGRYHRRACDH